MPRGNVYNRAPKAEVKRRLTLYRALYALEESPMYLMSKVSTTGQGSGLEDITALQPHAKPMIWLGSISSRPRRAIHVSTESRPMKHNSEKPSRESAAGKASKVAALRGRLRPLALPRTGKTMRWRRNVKEEI